MYMYMHIQLYIDYITLSTPWFSYESYHIGHVFSQVSAFTLASLLRCPKTGAATDRAGGSPGMKKTSAGDMAL